MVHIVLLLTESWLRQFLIFGISASRQTVSGPGPLLHTRTSRKYNTFYLTISAIARMQQQSKKDYYYFHRENPSTMLFGIDLNP